MADDQVLSSSNEFSEPPTYFISPCLRNKNSLPRQLSNRSVSFPDDESQIVTGYLDPPNPWEYAENANKETIISQYISSCERHGTKPIENVIQQLENFELEGDRIELLSLKGETLTTAACEALEEILKRIQLIKLDVESTGLDDEASVVLFDMIEYYEAATHLNISRNECIGGRGYQACSRMLKRAKCLEVLECEGTPLTEQYVNILGRALRVGTQLQVLKLNNCSLSGRPLVNLVAALKLNTVLKELHLSENELNTIDACQLGMLLRHNYKLQLLDISNNWVGDNGLEQVVKGLGAQQENGGGLGLNMLVLWNNHLTKSSAQHVALAIGSVKSLQVLNIGHNNFGDDLISQCQNNLTNSKTLVRFGIQSTGITCDGAVLLSQVIFENRSLQRIDIRDNNILLKGLRAICDAVKTNKTIARIDIDGPKLKFNLVDKEVEEYSDLCTEVKQICRENESSERDQEVLGRMKSSVRKISLTCNTLVGDGGAGGGLLAEPRVCRTLAGTRLRSPAPSPIPSPVTSPSPTRTRFQVSKVSEENVVVAPTVVVSGSTGSGGGGGGGGSRFKVTTVADPLGEVVAKDEGSVVSRASRKLSSWVSTTPSLLTENRTMEKLLGLLPWGGSRNQSQDLINNNGATWPPPNHRGPDTASPPHHHSTSTPSLVHTGSS